MNRVVDSHRRLPASITPAQHRLRGALPTYLVLGFVVLAGIAAVPALAAPARQGKPVKTRFAFDEAITPFQPSVTDPARFSFTAPGGNAASARLQTVERAFRFTPSGQGDNRKALSLGVTSRVVAAAVDRSRAASPVESIAALPASYNVDVSVAWKGFAVNTGFTRFDPGVTALLTGPRQSFDIGVSYRGRNWVTSLQGTAEQGGILLYSPLERRYSVALGGSYAVGPRVSVTGGVRYTLAPVSPSLLDTDRANQSIYFGTAFSF